MIKAYVQATAFQEGEALSVGQCLLGRGQAERGLEI